METCWHPDSSSSRVTSYFLLRFPSVALSLDNTMTAQLPRESFLILFKMPLTPPPSPFLLNIWQIFLTHQEALRAALRLDNKKHLDQNMSNIPLILNNPTLKEFIVTIISRFMPILCQNAFTKSVFCLMWIFLKMLKKTEELVKRDIPLWSPYICMQCNMQYSYSS